ncbi:MAG: hypothetical protein KDA42_10130 [Planctomycetales bacterium]|nr:hypothetical protein [Planctomycetales bacterium]
MEQTQDDVYLAASQPFVGRWNTLVSTTNWEKGRIIFEWRAALLEQGAAATEYSDEAWSQRVGNVTSQHVGRLRRAWERFGEYHDQYENLFWSHFQAALDWDDAEMWLEGAIQSQWSVSEMRRQRWEAQGAPDDLKPADADIYVGELDEDAGGDEATIAGVIQPELGVVQNTDNDADDSADEPSDEADDEPAASAAPRRVAEDDPAAAGEPSEPVRPFAELPSLPADLSEALEAFKLAIVRHRVAGWKETSPDDVVASLRALESLALAPLDAESPV